MKKTYADLCLERAQKATEEPWEILYAFGSQDLPVSIVHGDNSLTVLDWTERSSSSVADVEFIAHSRQDVPELAMRLNRACDYFRRMALFFKNSNIRPPFDFDKIADELERVREGK